MVLPLEWPILKRSWQDFQGTSEGLGRLVFLVVCGRLPSAFPRDPKLQCPTLPGSPASHAPTGTWAEDQLRVLHKWGHLGWGMVHHWPYLRCRRRRSPAAGAPRDAPGQAHGGAHGHCGRRARRRTDAPPSRSDGSCAPGQDLSAAPPLRPGGSCPGPRS